MTEQPFDAKRVLHLIWRHRRLAIAFVLLGLVAGAAYGFSRPLRYSASSLVLLPDTSGASAPNDISTDSQIAVSGTILGPVDKRIDPSLSLTALRQRIHAHGTATNVLQITAQGTSQNQAEALANSVASTLVKFVTSNTTAASASGLAALQAEASHLEQQIDNVNAEIASVTKEIVSVGSSSTAGQSDTALLAALTAQQSQSTLQLDNINSEIAVAQLGGSAANAGTEVIQKAGIATKASLSGPIINTVVGGLIGILTSSLLIIFLFRGDRRLRRRDQLAESVGVPVVLSLATTRITKTTEWVSFFEGYEPSSNDRWRVRKALRDLGVFGVTPTTLVVLALAGDDRSLVVAPQIAMCAAAQGNPVSLNATGKDAKAVDLRVAMEKLALSGRRPRYDIELQNGINQSGLTVISMVVDGPRPEILRARSAVTVLAVSAGFATAEDLARISIAAADADRPIMGLVVTNPDPDDLSSGRLAESVLVPGPEPYRLPIGAGRI